jgi:membrane dipeptidase
MRWFDAHLDLASLVERGRDMHAPLHDCGGDLRPPALTLPAMRDGRVRACMGTIFTQAVKDPAAPDAETAAYAYPLGDAAAAWKAGMRQLKLYRAWADAGVIRLLARRGHNTPAPPDEPDDPITLGILMECADPIETPDQLDEWADGGVVMIGMAWWHGSRYTGGNGTPGVGLTDLGRELIKRMDARGLVHDLSHLSQKATDELLETTDAPVVASHSNCRALLEPDNERHLTDATIAEIGKRGGVVGLNLVRNFIRTGLDRNDPLDRPTVAEAIDHVEHVCGVMGHRRGVGLGSDLDGGITANDLPAGINRPADYEKLAAELARRGWTGAEVEGFRWNNWARFWGIAR